MRKPKKPLNEYKWYRDACEKISEEPQEEKDKAILKFLIEKAKENGNGQD